MAFWPGESFGPAVYVTHLFRPVVMAFRVLIVHFLLSLTVPGDQVGRDADRETQNAQVGRQQIVHNEEILVRGFEESLQVT